MVKSACFHDLVNLMADQPNGYIFSVDEHRILYGDWNKGKYWSLRTDVQAAVRSTCLPKNCFLQRNVPGQEALGLCVVSPTLWRDFQEDALQQPETAASTQLPRWVTFNRRRWPTSDHLSSFSIQFGSATWHLPSSALPQICTQQIPA